MYRTVKTSFTANEQVINELYAINRTCAVIWNDCVQLARYYYRLGKKWITQTQLQVELKGLYPLHSQTIQAVAHKFLQAREGTKEARKKGYNNRYPWKTKHHFNAKWVDQSFSIEGKTLILSFGNVKGANGKRKPSLRLTLDHVPQGDVKEVELVYDRGLKICLSYENGKIEKENGSKRIVANDVGEIHTMSVVSDNGESLIITGRYIRSIHQFRNKKLAELQTCMARCQKGSRQWKKYNKAKQYLLSKSEAQLNDALHKTTKQFVAWCVEQETKKVLTGKVDGVQRNTKKERRKKTNQKLSNWSFGKLYQLLAYKLKAEGIEFEKVDEHYTTQTCPVCGNRKKTNSRNYKCKCGYQKHRDIHSACNILSKYLFGRFVEMKSNRPKYLHPVTLTRA